MVRDTNIHRQWQERVSADAHRWTRLAVNRCTCIRALVENDYVVNEREGGGEDMANATRSKNGQNSFVLGCAFISFQWYRRITGYINVSVSVYVGSRARARDRPSGRARDQKTGEGIIYRKWVVRRSGVI